MEENKTMVPRRLQPFFVAMLSTWGVIDIAEGRHWIGGFTLTVAALLTVGYFLKSNESEESKKENEKEN